MGRPRGGERPYESDSYTLSHPSRSDHDAVIPAHAGIQDR